MNEAALSQLYMRETAFQDLMQRRIHHVLLLASPYDAFMMEEDGRVEEQLYNEYVALNLSSPPRVTLVSDPQKALRDLSEEPYDLVIAMPGGDIAETLRTTAAIKSVNAELPVVLLTPFSREVSSRLSREDLSSIDYVFSWLGNVDLLLAIIKLLEDKLNAQRDILDVGVRAIMLVEDSVRFYSSVLPHLYRFLLTQSKEFSQEALNQHEQMLRMRGRPKVVLARDYEEAVRLYRLYGHNMLGVVSDVSFSRQGRKDPQAGLKLAHYLRGEDPTLPIIIESSETENAARVAPFQGVFIDKNSKQLPQELRRAIRGRFGFGPFYVKDPVNGAHIMRIDTLNELQRRIFNIPDEALFRHARNNDISRWLYSRALFSIADVVREHHFVSIDEAPRVKQLFFDLIVKYRRMKNRGVVAVFRRGRFDTYSNFARIGDGSMGGKARGLAFIDSILKRTLGEGDDFEGVTMQIPRSVVLCTDIFDEFMDANGLYPLALSDTPDAEILEAFVRGRLPDRVMDDLRALISVMGRPLAVRSSSLLEDSHYQPFAGVYSTYMLPYLQGDAPAMLRHLTTAIKAVYASVFYAESKAYMTATSNVIDQEKMAVIIQEVVGDEWTLPMGKDTEPTRLYFPSFSGVARSLNYYPVGDETTTDGVAQVAVGLGRYIVDGSRALRFCPRYPDKSVQASTMEAALRDTQTSFMALDLSSLQRPISTDEGYNIAEQSLQTLKDTGALRLMVSTYDPSDQCLRPGEQGRGRRVATFEPMLRHQALPLARAVDFMLTTGCQAMGRPVEIEFAGNTTSTPRPRLYWLQMRPIIDNDQCVSDELIQAPAERYILHSNTALGHGNIQNVRHIVYVRPQGYDSQNNCLIAEEISQINRTFTAQGQGYVLIGPGRWGSSDSALGIPVRWAQIAAARVIVESSLADYRVEPSQGTHFFQNLTSMGAAYFTVNPWSHDGIYDTAYLDALPAQMETPLVRVVAFAAPLLIAVDGLRGIGVVMKPVNTPTQLRP